MCLTLGYQNDAMRNKDTAQVGTLWQQNTLLGTSQRTSFSCHNLTESNSKEGLEGSSRELKESNLLAPLSSDH